MKTYPGFAVPAVETIPQYESDLSRLELCQRLRDWGSSESLYHPKPRTPMPGLRQSKSYTNTSEWALCNNKTEWSRYNQYTGYNQDRSYGGLPYTDEIDPSLTSPVSSGTYKIPRPQVVNVHSYSRSRRKGLVQPPNKQKVLLRQPAQRRIEIKPAFKLEKGKNIILRTQGL